MGPVLVASQITKQFPGVRALDGVDLDLVPGEVHALVGENGAGKSTLIKILAGLLHPSSGIVEVHGKEVHFESPLESQAAGISVIAQEFNLVPQMTVAENIFLGREPLRKGELINWKAANEQAAKILAELGLRVSPRVRVEFLSVADKQLVEIAKALSLDFQVMIMDEPTAALNTVEVERLFDIITGLKKRNVAVLYVSHRLKEIFRIADRVTVLRDGKRVGTRLVKECTEHDVIAMMLGRAIEQQLIGREMPPEAGMPALAVHGLAVPGVFSDVSFDLMYGEVLGCAGLVGSGRSELMRALFGVLPHTGDVIVDGAAVQVGSPGKALEVGIFMLAEDRKVEGIFPDLTVVENLLVAARTLNGKPQGMLIDQDEERKKYAEVKDSFSIRAHSPSQMIPTLSGGNQQKVMLGRALVSRCRILLLNEPTRGVDVGTKVEIYELIRRLANSGVAVLVSSSDVPEVVTLSDRCLVMGAGRLVTTLVGEQITEEHILASAMGHAMEGGA